MALNLTNLDAKPRNLLVEEIDHDINAGCLYMSPRLNASGQAQYLALLKEVALLYNDVWLVQQIRSKFKI